MGYIKQGDAAIMWGYVPFDAKFYEFASGKCKAGFTLTYGNSKDANGHKTPVNVYCEAWGKLAKEYCAGIEKGDNVIVAGYMVKDDWSSEKKGKEVYKLNVSFVSVQQYYDNAANNSTDEAAEFEEITASSSSSDHPARHIKPEASEDVLPTIDVDDDELPWN